MPPNTCDPERLPLVLGEGLTDAERREFERHLDGCIVCRERLDRAAIDADTCSELVGVLRDDRETAEDSDPLAGLAHLLAPSEWPGSLGRLNNLEVTGVIGRGGMAVVFRADDLGLKRTVAVKVLAPWLADGPAARKRFAREARAAAAVTHDNVLPIHAVSECRGVPLLVMPYQRGGSLERRLKRDGPFGLVSILRVAYQVASGLAAAHAQGVTHRDIKPANVLVEEGSDRVWIADFGLAFAADDAGATRSNALVGTPPYMSPEQADGRPLDGRSDLFSLGSLIYALATGAPPFAADTTLGVLRRIRSDAPAPLRKSRPDLPAWLDAVVAKLLAKEPAGRYPDADSCAKLLGLCLAHAQDPKAHALPTELRPARRLPWRILAAGCVIFGVALAVLAGGGRRPPDPEAPSEPSESETRWRDGTAERLREIDEGLRRLNDQTEREVK